MSRKIIQIVSDTAADDGDWNTNVYALCDDGTLWRKRSAEENQCHTADQADWDEVDTSEIADG